MTRTLFHSKTLFQLVVALTGVAVFALWPSMAAAQTDTLSTSVADMTAEVVFDRSTPCTPYTVAWGDDEETVVEGDADAMCIQVIDTVTLEHDYETEGTYDIVVTTGGNDYEATVTVPKEVVSFDLEDVASITSTWVDPNEMMADEEYYIYNVTLTSGEEVSFRVAGFTMIELRDEAFRDAGYTGDVPALLAVVEETETNTPVTETPDEPEVVLESDASIYAQIKALLESVVAKLQQLLALQ